ncbi:MAG: cupin domain-containing protein [Dehalococcoidia bacterium]
MDTKTKAAIFRSVSAIPEERGVCGYRRRLITNDDTDTANITYLRIDDSKMHYHKTMTEFYYVLSGGGTITLDGEASAITAGDLVMIPPGIRHTSDGEMDVLIMGVPPQELDDVHFD